MTRSDFDGLNVLVTGGASGIGQATVEQYARAGAHVTIADRAVALGEEVATSLTGQGLSVRFEETDVTVEADVAAVVQVAARGTGLDIAANCAGGDLGNGPDRDLTKLELTDWNRTVDLSMTSVFLSMKHEIIAMRASGGGSIVNVTALAGMRASVASSSAYGAAKAGVAHLTRWAAVVHGRDNIRVNCVAPGVTLTPMVRAGMTAERMSEVLGTLHVIERGAEPGELAAAIVWLSSKQAAMTTGHEFPVDGGWTAR